MVSNQSPSTNRVLSVCVPSKTAKDIIQQIKTGSYINTSDFLRAAIRRELQAKEVP